MDLQSVLSDDQIAVMGCFAALTVCGFIAAMSFHFGPAGKSSQQAAERQSLKIPTNPASGNHTEDRRAA